ncbi:uncharacterized protein [Panulirus ornatus]|uniref:uncharacterized protein isoform X2 n=1 Tax=Panulirus ornatus TaxID=150431 RepID=UPI003A8C28BE
MNCCRRAEDQTPYLYNTWSSDGWSDDLSRVSVVQVVDRPPVRSQHNGPGRVQGRYDPVLGRYGSGRVQERYDSALGLGRLPHHDPALGPGRPPHHDPALGPGRSPHHDPVLGPGPPPHHNPALGLGRPPHHDPALRPGRSPHHDSALGPGRPPHHDSALVSGRPPHHDPALGSGRPPHHDPALGSGRPPHHDPALGSGRPPHHDPALGSGRPPHHDPALGPGRPPHHDPALTPGRPPHHDPALGPGRPPQHDPALGPGRPPHHDPALGSGRPPHHDPALGSGRPPHHDPALGPERPLHDGSGYDTKSPPGRLSLEEPAHAPGRPSHHAPGTTSKTLPPSQEIHQGLPNLGNTCYMNAVIQCLYHTSYLTQYFRRGVAQSDINERSLTKGEVALTYAGVVQALETGRGKEVALRTLRMVCGEYDHQFRGDDQKEAHDLLGCLLQWLHEDLASEELGCACPRQQRHPRGMAHESPSHRPAPPRQGHHNNTASLHSWQERTSVHHPAGGFTGVRDAPLVAGRGPGNPLGLEAGADGGGSTAGQCGKCGVEREVESLVSRTVVGIQQSTIVCPALGAILCRTHERFTNLTLAVNLTGEVHLEEVLASHYRVQEILWPCQSCGKDHICHQQTRIISLPHVLIIHLSRGCRYTLYGVCNHRGTSSSGHYTAICRRLEPHRQHGWFLYDDDFVKVTPHCHRPYETHILFYESQGR